MLPLTHIWTHTRSSINFWGQRHCESSADWQVNVECHWLCDRKRGKKARGEKRRKALCGEQWPQFRTHAAWGQLSPFFSPPPPPSAKSPPARASTVGKRQNGLCDTWIYYTTAVLFGETSSTAFKTTWLELQHCCLQIPPCVYCHQAVLPNA